MAKSVHIYAGPSLFGTPFQRGAETSVTEKSAVVWWPPARRGDIATLTAKCNEPGVLALADGTFHAYPSVCHVELREAIHAGWLVYGMCSMGAIRVSEMFHMGMLPWGRVAHIFCADADMADDEVALLHASDPPYAPLSEPMVHIREFLSKMQDQGLLSPPAAAAVGTSLRERWYGDRTLLNLRKELFELVGESGICALDQRLVNFSPYRLKQQDLVSFIVSRPWLAVAASRSSLEHNPALLQTHP